ncbi:hypothetical protein J4G33_14440 [Actinotalea sp. BY-33]|uniref:Uncharacterized protein n=1 Tax=Actinotalea soli TaxID=2819234 RepID=A0A939RWV2_9CELL|nr:hypothetical protein [Actinotalea soli]MBO1753008.1 hypothetical protein [Actinotalea soli]
MSAEPPRRSAAASTSRPAAPRPAPEQESLDRELRRMEVIHRREILAARGARRPAPLGTAEVRGPRWRA